MEDVAKFYGHLVYLHPFGIFYMHLVKFYMHLVYFTCIWYILHAFGIFYMHLVYFTCIWCILWTFGIFWGNLIYFSPLWYVVLLKIWQPWHKLKLKEFFELRNSGWPDWANFQHFWAVLWPILKLGYFFIEKLDKRWVGQHFGQCWIPMGFFPQKNSGRPVWTPSLRAAEWVRSQLLHWVQVGAWKYLWDSSCMFAINRVTRLIELSPLGRIFSWGFFSKI
jgi:hypothetical protein